MRGFRKGQPFLNPLKGLCPGRLAGGEAHGGAEKAVSQRGVGPGATLYQIQEVFCEDAISAGMALVLAIHPQLLDLLGAVMDDAQLHGSQVELECCLVSYDRRPTSVCRAARQEILAIAG